MSQKQAKNMTKKEAILSAIRGSNEDQRKMVERAQQKRLLDNWRKDLMPIIQKELGNYKKVNAFYSYSIVDLFEKVLEAQQVKDSNIAEDYGLCACCSNCPDNAHFISEKILNQYKK